jgi:hypothetical protein
MAVCQATICSLCGRTVSSTNRHHLIPRTTHNGKTVKNKFSTEEKHITVDFCRDCHRMVHAIISERNLVKHYHTIESLQEHPEIANYLQWVRTRPECSVTKAKRSKNW